MIANDGRKTATECAIEAGYDKDSAYVTASRLQNPKHYPLVVQYIGDRKSEMLKKYDVTYEHTAELGKIRDEAELIKLGQLREIWNGQRKSCRFYKPICSLT